MKPFCKETEFRGLGSVWLLGGSEGSVDPLRTGGGRRKLRGYVHTRDGVNPLSSNGERPAGNRKADSALISPNLPRQHRQGLQIIMDS